MALKGPPKGGPQLPSLGSQQAAPTAEPAPEFEPWGDETALPSLLVLGASGSGKTDAIRKLCMAGFKLAVVEIEPKVLGLAQFSPLRVRLCKPVTVGGNSRMPTAIERYDRMMRHLDGLRAGKYRVALDGSPIDILAYDGLTEAGDLIAASKFGGRFKVGLDDWTRIGKETIDLFKDLRDAAGIASTELGLPPVGIMATCGEASPKKLDIKAGTSSIERDQPVLPGNMALVRLPSVFEVIWRLSAGSAPGGGHEWRVATQLGDTYLAKSPGGLFDVIETGPGGTDEHGKARAPDIGAMYHKLLEDPRSQYCRKSA